jgi:glycosyltransferase involved in cell wall biosynthesis
MGTWIVLLCCAGGGWAFLRRLRNVRARSLPGLGPRGEQPDCGQVSIVVPARDEAQNLPALLRSLAQLHGAPLEVLVVDDQSRDGTADVARTFGARVVNPGPRPTGYIGKPWACLAGAQAARGRYLLFTDADTVHAPDSLVRALAALQEVDAGLVSWVPTHRLVAGWERLQGAFQLLLLIATRADARRTSAARPFAIGQYLLFDREVYQAFGGHAATPQRIAEDLALARLVARQGRAVRVLFGPGALTVRMYPDGLRSFFAGWRRNFRDGLHAAPRESALEVGLVIGWLLGVPIWFVEAVLRGDWAAAAAWFAGYLGTSLLIAREQRHYGAFSRASAFAYPLAVLAFVAVTASSLLDALLRKPVRWRGRSFQWVAED